jgi:3-oxoacyl-[acyl-carrier protein] reductase
MWSVLEAGAKASGQDRDAYAKLAFSEIGAKGPGDPNEFGAVYTFLYSQHAAYVTAQNILIDGGLFPGTL